MMTCRLLFVLIPVLLASWGAATVITPLLPFPFFRVFDRCLLVLAMLAVLFFQKRIRKKPFTELGLEGQGRVAKNLSAGIAFSLISVLTVTGVSLLSRFSVLAYHPPPHMRKIFNYFFASILTAFFEEFFFRGCLFKTLRDDFSPSWSMVVSSAVFSLAHFIRPFFTDSHDLSLFYTEAFGLFLFGILLAYACFRTGSLYLSMGLHGGFVLFLKMDGILVNRLMRYPSWIFGEERLIGGVVTWSIFLVAVPWIKGFTQKNSLQGKP